MAISVNTDLVLDVLGAGNPERAAIADAALQTKKIPSIEIAAAGEKFATELASKDIVTGPNNLDNLRQKFTEPLINESFKKFEAVILEQFVKDMMPQDSSAVFGEGTAGDIWKGMMAEQMGSAIAKGGGIGIAQQLQTRSESTSQAANIINSNERDVLDSLDESAN